MRRSRHDLGELFQPSPDERLVVYRARREFGPVLLTVAVVEAAISSQTPQSCPAVEARLGNVKKRVSRKSGSQDTNHIRKLRRGEHVGTATFLKKIADVCPDAKAMLNSPLWRLLASGKLTVSLRSLIDVLDDNVFWLLNAPTPLTRNLRPFSLLIEDPEEDALLRLTVIGSLDAVVALWILLEDARQEADTAQALRIGRYLSLALALWSLTAIGQRIALLVYARLRQTVLDKLVHDGRCLALSSYRPWNRLERISGWVPGGIGPANPHGRERVEIPAVIAQWVRESLPADRSVRGRKEARLWAAGDAPSERLARLPASLQFHPKAVEILKSSLESYW